MGSLGSESRTPSNKHDAVDLAARVHRGVLVLLQLIMAVELFVAFYEEHWETVFLVMAIMAVVLAPTLLGRQLGVDIPSEFQVLVVLFTFAALFLGEIRSYYERIWWWDIALHASSGLLLGILGFLLVYVMNENERVDLDMRPRFVAFFAFVFAVAVGALWEVFEFTMDQIVGTTMQKPMFADLSGLTDTMWDLIVNAVGALGISAFAWWYMNDPGRSFIEVWIRRFIDRNPRLFRARRHLD